MKMLLEKNRLIELLYHEDSRVKDASAEALAKFFAGSGDVMEHLLEAMDACKNDETRLSLAVKINFFTPTEKDLKKILRLCIDLESKTDENSITMKWHLNNSLLEFPFPLLERNYSFFSANKSLSDLYEAAKNLSQLKAAEPDVLWEQLVEFCNRYRDKEMESDENRYCQLLVTSLSQPQKGEQIKENVIAYFSRDTDVNYHLEFYLVELAGNLKIKETIPYLFDILLDSDPLTYVYSSSLESLGRIAGPEVVEEIGTLYPRYEDLRGTLADILGYMPYDYAEEKAVQLLKEETDPETRTFLAGALCDIFSVKSGDMIIDIIRNRQYDPSIIELLNELIPVYVYHNKTIDHLAELERIDREFQDGHFEAHPLFGLGKHFNPLEDDDAVEDEEPDVPDVYASYIKERKKMPVSRIPSKKKNKGKKK